MERRTDRVFKAVQEHEPAFLELTNKYAAAFRACHPVGKAGIISALYYKSKITSKNPCTEEISRVFGQHNIPSQVFGSWLSDAWSVENDWTAENKPGHIIVKTGYEGKQHVWGLTEDACNANLPELAMLTVKWIDKHPEDMDPFRFLENREMGEAREDLSLLKVLYLTSLYLEENKPELSRHTSDFLNAQKIVADKVVGDMEKNSRREMRFSLTEARLLQKSPDGKRGEYSLTEGGKSFIEEVVLPFSALTADPDEFYVDSRYEDARHTLLDTSDVLNDRKQAQLLLERFGVKLSNRYETKKKRVLHTKKEEN
jgi:hypothetical protein